MKFGPVPVSAAEGAILAHSMALPGQRLHKGQVLEPAHLQSLTEAGVAQVTVARLETGDVEEGTAATRLAEALMAGCAARITPGRAFTGRVNLIADGPGVVTLDAAAIDAFNAVHPMITLATVADRHQIRPGGMIATIKIIAYAVPEEAVARAARVGRGAIALAAPVLKTATLIVTETTRNRGSKADAAIAARLEALDMTLQDTHSVPHDTGALVEAIGAARGDLVLILTGSATSDPEDTAPAALRAAGGQVTRFGMPVDPGNLLFLGSIGARPVIGLPGCARAPALNGADWVMSRIACGLEVTAQDIAGMGVGGLLKEIPTRPMPRRGRREANGDP